MRPPKVALVEVRTEFCTQQKLTTDLFLLGFVLFPVQMPGITVKDVDQDKVVQGVALFLKK